MPDIANDEDNTVPGATPVRPSTEQMDRNEREARAEIGRRARDLARRCIEYGEAVTPKDLEHFGPTGQADFFKFLREGLDAKLQLQKRLQAQQAPSWTQAAATALLRAKRNWADQRMERASYVRRAIESGFWLAVFLTVPIVVALHTRADWDLWKQVLTINRSMIDV